MKLGAMPMVVAGLKSTLMTGMAAGLVTGLGASKLLRMEAVARGGANKLDIVVLDSVDELD